MKFSLLLTWNLLREIFMVPFCGCESIERQNENPINSSQVTSESYSKFNFFEAKGKPMGVERILWMGHIFDTINYQNGEWRIRKSRTPIGFFKFKGVLGFWPPNQRQWTNSTAYWTAKIWYRGTFKIWRSHCLS